MTPRQSLDHAKRASAAQRRKLRRAAMATRERLTPARLTDDAKQSARTAAQEVKRDMVAHARAHPIMTALGVSALIAWALRKPLLNHAPSAVSRAYAFLSGKLAFSEWMADRGAQVASNDIAANNVDNQELPHG
ncbi:MAG: hypothetical protein ABL874_08865 [Sphingopyxis sp.]